MRTASDPERGRAEAIDVGRAQWRLGLTSRTLLDRLSKLLRGYYRAKLSRIGREATEAEDVMQDVLTALHTRRHTYDPKQLFMPWVYAIARYKLIDHLRRTRASLADVPLDVAGELAAQEDHAGVESRHDLSLLLRGLPEKMRSRSSA